MMYEFKFSVNKDLLPVVMDAITPHLGNDGAVKIEQSFFTNCWGVEALLEDKASLSINGVVLYGLHME